MDSQTNGINHIIPGYAQAQAQNGGMQIGGWTPLSVVSGNMLKVTNEPSSFLGEVYGQISAATKEVIDITDHARSAADAVFGYLPETANSAIGRPPRDSGRAADIREQIELLHGAINVLRDEVRRLRAL